VFTARDSVITDSVYLYGLTVKRTAFSAAAQQICNNMSGKVVSALQSLSLSFCRLLKTFLFRQAPADDIHIVLCFQCDILLF